MKKNSTSLIYALCDFFASGLSWALFYIVLIGNQPIDHFITSGQFVKGFVILPVIWVLTFLVTGFYIYSLKRSRLEELIYSIAITLPITLLIFFFFLTKGIITDNTRYLNLFLAFFCFQFTLTYLPRVVITTINARKVHKGLLGSRTLIIGSNGSALEVYRKISGEKIRSGSIITGYIRIARDKPGLIGDLLPCLGTLDDLPAIIPDKGIEEVIIAIENDEHDTIGSIIGLLNYSDVTVKAIPSLKDLLTGRVEQTSIYGTPLLEVTNRLLPVWQANFKQVIDYVVAITSLILLSPLIVILTILIKVSGPGPVIYSQVRTGKNGKPFTMYKLRSMTVDAEKEEPLLSNSNDHRVTTIGRFMRRHRVDEIPNLVNVLKGEMSLVGPRPERQYFIDQIVKKAPHYRRLLKVKPGITSWGQVKYGYASSVDQMIERLEYDLLYLENMSLFIDLKIIIYTGLIIINGKGV